MQRSHWESPSTELTRSCLPGLSEGNTPTSTQHPSPTAGHGSPTLCHLTLHSWDASRTTNLPGRSWQDAEDRQGEEKVRGECGMAGDSEDFSGCEPPPPLSGPASESPTETFPALLFTVRVSSEPHPRLPNGISLLEGQTGEDLTPGSPGASALAAPGCSLAGSLLPSLGELPRVLFLFLPEPAALCDIYNQGPKQTEEGKAR